MPAGLCAEAPVGEVSLPSDDASHDASLEWWYWTGHLKTDEGKWLGFEEVFFAGQSQGTHGILTHSALTDIDGGVFYHAVNETIGTPTETANGFNLTLGSQQAVGGGGHDALLASPTGARFSLTLDALARPVFQYGTGYASFSNGSTYYYSRERMAVKGQVTLGGKVVPVTGSAWFDHQWGDLQSIVTQGWQWFALQLDDGRSIMVNVPRAGGAVATGSVTDAACATTILSASDVKLTSLGTWTSPHTQCTYPMGWTLAIGGETFTVTPALVDQELPESTPIYWEGASTVTGSATGRAYVELNSFCN